MTVKVQLQNTGNSPAIVEQFIPKYDLPDGWKELDSTFVGGRWPGNTLPSISPRSEVEWKYYGYFELSPTAFEVFTKATSGSTFRLHGQLRFKDVFQKIRSADWCWAVEAVGEKNVRPTPCGDEERWR